MIEFKCTECEGLQYSSCISREPCIYCGGKIEVENVGKPARSEK